MFTVWCLDLCAAHMLFALAQIQHVFVLCVFHHRTPLHYAAASRHFQCLETLVSCGTCINATDQWGRSALHYAAASDLDRRYSSKLPCFPSMLGSQTKKKLVCKSSLPKQRFLPERVCRT